MTDIAIEVSNLHKSYGDREVVAGVSFSVGRGQMIGLLGPNGAGKTTTVSMICGLTPISAGQVLVCGEMVGNSDRAKRRIGLVPQDLALFENLSARANLQTFGALYGLSGPALEKRCDAALELVGLADRGRDRPDTFSGGMKRRLNLACALLHDPDVLLLDEPTVGIDPQSRNAIFENLETLQSLGKTIVYTTHYMEEVERLCDRVVIMDHGKIVADDTLEGLAGKTPNRDVLTVTVSGECNLAAIEGTPGVRAVTRDGNTLRFSLNSLSNDVAAVLAALREQHVTIERIDSDRASLETYFLALTGRQLRDDTP